MRLVPVGSTCSFKRCELPTLQWQEALGAPVISLNIECHFTVTDQVKTLIADGRSVCVTH